MGRIMLKVDAFVCGWIEMPLHFLLEGIEGDIAIPIPSYVIRHPRGIAVFDSGLVLELIDDPVAPIHPLESFQKVSMATGSDLASRLRSIDIALETVDHVINSHLHFDHCGGNALLPNATMVIQRREWEQASDRSRDPDNYVIRHYDHGQDRLLLDGEHDLFGDGSVICVPTYGHTHGHQSLRIRDGDGELLLAGDACYLCRTLEQLHPAFSSFDKEEASASLHRIHDRWKRGARVIPGHEPSLWESHPDGHVRLI